MFCSSYENVIVVNIGFVVNVVVLFCYRCFVVVTVVTGALSYYRCFVVLLVICRATGDLSSYRCFVVLTKMLSLLTLVLLLPLFCHCHR